MARTAVITGASGGIGSEVARELARRGWRIAVVGRNTSRTEEVARMVDASMSLEGGTSTPVDVPHIVITTVSQYMAVNAPVVIDVVGLHTNIPQDEGVQCVEEALGERVKYIKLRRS